eukprot:Nk52_evm54s78 gene=Nk52_evmTU54s78
MSRSNMGGLSLNFSASNLYREGGNPSRGGGRKKVLRPEFSSQARSSVSKSTTELNRILKEWDKGSKAIRQEILEEFIEVCESKTGPQLEKEFSNGGSLFLTRLTAFLRLTYLLNFCLGLQIKAISIFITASSGHRFLNEFVEVGGVLTILEILGLDIVKDEDKYSCLQLIMSVGKSGRKYKELICESYGVRAVTECMIKATSDNTRLCSRNVLYELGIGNPKYQHQVYKALVSLLPSSSSGAQQMAAQGIRLLLPSLQQINAQIIEPSLSLLKSQHLEVQYEGCELLKGLCSQGSLQQAILSSLIALLKPNMDDVFVGDENEGENAEGGGIHVNIRKKEKRSRNEGAKAIPPEFLQQSTAAKMLGVLAALSSDMAKMMVQLQAPHGLLVAMGNAQYNESRKQAHQTLVFLIKTFPEVGKAIYLSFGEGLFTEMITQTDTFWKNTNKTQIDLFTTNTLRIAELGDIVDLNGIKDIFDDGNESLGSVDSQEEEELEERERNPVILNSASSEDDATQLETKYNNMQSKEQSDVPNLERPSSSKVTEPKEKEIYTPYVQPVPIQTSVGLPPGSLIKESERAAYDIEEFREKVVASVQGDDSSTFTEAVGSISQKFTKESFQPDDLAISNFLSKSATKEKAYQYDKATLDSELMQDNSQESAIKSREIGDHIHQT